jgi:hypothetical protein
MRDNVLCSKIKLEKKSDENERLTNEFQEMKKLIDRLEQENQKFKVQIENERKKVNKKKTPPFLLSNKFFLSRLKNVQNSKLHPIWNYKIFKKNYVHKDMNMKVKLLH